MADNNNKFLNEDTVFRASVHFYSKGTDGNVTLGVEVSHPMDDDYEGEVPASYAQVYELVMGLRRNAVLYAANDDETAFLADPDLTAERKAELVLEKVKAQEEAFGATIN